MMRLTFYKMQDWFSGLGGAHSGMPAKEWEVFTLDLDERFGADLVKDMIDVTLDELPDGPNFVWISFPCNCFSIASVQHHWKDGKPSSPECKAAIKLLKHTLELVKGLQPDYWVLENPRGMMRTLDFMRAYPRVTITQCQYGSKFMKPTDLWGWFPWSWDPRPMCAPEQPCHENPGRGGSDCGLQAEPDPARRALIPIQLSEDLGRAVKYSLTHPIPSWMTAFQDCF